RHRDARLTDFSKSLANTIIRLLMLDENAMEGQVLEIINSQHGKAPEDWQVYSCHNPNPVRARIFGVLLALVRSIQTGELEPVEVLPAFLPYMPKAYRYVGPKGIELLIRTGLCLTPKGAVPKAPP